MQRYMLLIGILFVGLRVVAGEPRMLHYQGRVAVDGTNFTGAGQFKFALVNADGNLAYWSNDGSSTTGQPPAEAVSLPVNKGLYSVLLGDVSLGAAMMPFPSGLFNHSALYLRVWFNDGVNGFLPLSPDQQLAAAAYAMVADGVSAGAVGTNELDLAQVDQRYALKNVVAGLAGSNTFFIAATAPAGGDGSLGRPWNTLDPLTNNADGRYNGKTVVLLAGTYLTGCAIVLAPACRNLTIKGLDPQNVRVVSTNDEACIFSCDAGVTNILFEGLSLTSTNGPFGTAGGAMLLVPGVTVRRCTFTGCSAFYGGAVACYGGALVEDCIFADNTAAFGGAAWIQGAVFRRCDFSGNSVRANGSGGALFDNAGGTVADCTFTANIATNGGGGGALASASGRVRNCVFRNNAAHAGGAVIGGARIRVEDCLFTANSAAGSAGALSITADDTVSRSTFDDNTAAYYGGAVYCSAGGAVLNCNFSGNSAPSGGGVYCYQAGKVQGCSIIRGGGTTNAVYSDGLNILWMSVWTNTCSAADFVTFSTSLNN